MLETVSNENNENNEKVEQITKIPAAPLKKLKDPKKVAAGKKLADYNRRAKQKQKEVKESQPPVPEENDNEANDWLPKTSLTTIIALIGLGFTAFDLFYDIKVKRLGVKKQNLKLGWYQNNLPHLKQNRIQLCDMEWNNSLKDYVIL